MLEGTALRKTKELFIFLARLTRTKISNFTKHVKAKAVIYYFVLATELRTLHLQDRHCATELYPWPSKTTLKDDPM